MKKQQTKKISNKTEKKHGTDSQAMLKNAQENIKTPTLSSIFLKATLLSLLLAFIMLVITALSIGTWGLFKLNHFVKIADTSIEELKTVAVSGWNQPVTQTNFKKNILLLGIDTLKTRPGSPALTDTIMLISLDLKTAKISTISLPRDIWSDKYKTRINALYFYGQKKYPNNPERFTKETIQDLTGVNIHHTIVVSIDSVAQIIDILGGIDVDVKESFTDTQFPRPSIDVTKTIDPSKLYQTVIFKKGLQHMNGEKTLQFIRSRKSGDDQGNDLARATRQQIIIDSLIKRIEKINPIKDIEILAKLYKYYNENFSKQFSIKEAIATIKVLLPSKDNISFENSSLSVFPKDKFGVITNPPIYKYKGQWVYEIVNKVKFKQEILTKLNLNN